MCWFTFFRDKSGGPPAARSTGALTCRTNQSTLAGYTGIGVTYSTNVLAQLIDGQGRVVIPSDRDTDVASNGIEFESLIFLDTRVAPGRYTVEVTHNGRELETYSLALSRDNSPALTIVCAEAWR